MTENATRFRDYQGNSSEETFTQIVKDHVDLVYSAALRVVAQDTHLARDVAQVVFIDLARKIRELPPDVVVAGWLYRHASFTASKAVRTERRRQARERQAVELQMLNEESDSVWSQMTPVLDEAMNRLSTRERDAIVLRYFQQKPLRAVGASLGISEEAARKRVDRAIDQLRGLLVRRGLALSSATVATVLEAKSVSAAPAGLAASLSAQCASTAASASAGFVQSLAELFLMTKIQATVIGVLFLAGIATPVIRSAVAGAKSSAGTASKNSEATSLAITQKTQVTSSVQAPVDTAFARLERWVRQLDQTHQPYQPWSIDESELGFLVWSLPLADYPRAWALRDGLRYDEIQNRLQRTLLQYWAELEPRAALAAAQSIAGAQGWSSLSVEVLSTWAGKEPAAALAWIRQASPEKFRIAALTEAIPEAAKTEPALALNALAELPTGKLRERILASTLRQWAMTDPATAAQYLTNITSSALRSDAAQWIAKTWGGWDSDAALKWAESLSKGEARQNALRFALWGLADKDPAHTAALVDKYTQTEPHFSYPWVDDLVKSWAAEDLPAAANWATGLTNDLERQEALRSVIWSWNEQDLAGAAQFAAALPDQKTRQDGTQAALKHWAEKEPQSALAWANSLPAGPLQDAALKGVCEAMAQEDPVQAAQFVASLPPGKFQSDTAADVAYRWACTAPKDAANWVSIFPEGAARDRAAQRVIDGWVFAAQDAGSAADWLEQLPPGSTRDAAARNFVQAAASRRPELAAPWIRAFSNEAQRNQQIEQIARKWLSTDPDAARQWLETTSLPQAAKQQLLKN